MIEVIALAVVIFLIGFASGTLFGYKILKVDTLKMIKSYQDEITYGEDM